MSGAQSFCFCIVRKEDQGRGLDVSSPLFAMREFDWEPIQKLTKLRLDRRDVNPRFLVHAQDQLRILVANYEELTGGAQIVSEASPDGSEQELGHAEALGRVALLESELRTLSAAHEQLKERLREVETMAQQRAETAEEELAQVRADLQTQNKQKLSLAGQLGASKRTQNQLASQVEELEKQLQKLEAEDPVPMEEPVEMENTDAGAE